MRLKYLEERSEVDDRSGDKAAAGSEDPERQQCTDAGLSRTLGHRSVT